MIPDIPTSDRGKKHVSRWSRIISRTRAEMDRWYLKCVHWSACIDPRAFTIVCLCILVFVSFFNYNAAAVDSEGHIGNANDILFEQFPEHHFGYVWYATNAQYFCSAMVSMEHLLRTNPHHNIDLVFIIPEQRRDIISDRALQRLDELRATRTIVIKETAIPYHLEKWYYHDVMLKLTAFTLYEYRRVLITDSDALIFRNLDHLFNLPDALVATPHAQWLEGGDKPIFTTSLLLVIRPDRGAWSRIEQHFQAKTEEADMDIINNEFRMDMITLPSEYAALDVALATDKDAMAWYGEKAEDLVHDLFVIHFTGFKPWQVSVDPPPEWAQDKPVYFGLFQLWHQIESQVC